MFKLTFLIKAYNLIVIDSAIDFIFQVFDRSNAFFTIISNALNSVPIDKWGISIHYTFGNKTAVCGRCVLGHNNGRADQTSRVMGCVLAGGSDTFTQKLIECMECVVCCMLLACISIQFCLWFMCVNIDASLRRRARSIRETAVTFTDCD